MDFEALLEEFSETFDIEITSVEAGDVFQSSFENGKTTVSFSKAGRNAARLESRMVEIPNGESESADFLETALKGNLMCLKEGGSVLSLGPDKSALILSKTLDLSSIDPRQLHDKLENFLHEIDVFRNGLEKS